MKKLAIQLLVTAVLLAGCGDGSTQVNVNNTPSPSPTASPAETPAPTQDSSGKPDEVTSASPLATHAPVDNENPIDRHINFELAASTYEINAVSYYYLQSWKEELNNVATLTGKSDVIKKIDERAEFAANEEGEQWGDGSGRRSAEAMASAGVYKQAAYSMIAELKEKGEEYGYVFAYEYKPLLDSFINSQVLHFNPFKESPDSVTANLTMYSFVALGKQLPEQEKLPKDLKELVLSDTQTGNNVLKFSPVNLYKNSFLNGSYEKPPAILNGIIQEKHGSLTYKVAEPSVMGVYEILAAENQGDVIKLTVSLSRVDITQGDSAPVILGLGTVELKKTPEALCKYTIQSYNAEYEKFDDLL